MCQMRRSLCAVALVIFLAALPVGLCAEEQTSESGRIAAVIRKVIDTYGGKEAIEGVHSLYAKGKIEAFMLRDQGTYELYFKRGRKLRVETKYAKSSEVRILDENRGYRSTDKLPLQEVYGHRYLSMVYQCKHLDILHDLLSGTYESRSMGQSFVSGKKVEVFRLNDKEGAVMDIFVDTQEAVIIKVTAYFSSGRKQIDLSAEFSDFQKVGDSLYPFRITNYAGGLKVAETVIEKYSLNPEIPPSLFAPTVFQSL
jgi:hypothetical protein